MLPDFDTLLTLAKSDPDALDRIKQEAVQALLDSACETNKPRLRGLQWQIDIEIQKSKSPMEGCVNVSKLMHNKLRQLKIALDDQDKGRVDAFFYDEVIDNTAEVIPLHR